MDPALQRERDLFRKRAFDLPTVEVKRKREEPAPEPKKKPKVAESAVTLPGSSRFKSLAAASSTYRFGVLTKMVQYMKKKFQDGEDHPLSFEEILDETNQLDVSSKVQQWLSSEALPNNPKLEQTHDGKYIFKPSLKCRDKKSLIRLLKQHDLKGLGGIYREDVVESVPHAERVLKAIDSEIVTIARQDKKKVLFYNDRHADLVIDEEFQKNWRAVAVDGIDDAKIEDYLDKQGIRSMQDQGIKKPVQRLPRRKAQKKKMNRGPKDNVHIAEELVTYDD